MKITWNFVISAVCAGIVFDPRLWHLSACRRSLSKIEVADAIGTAAGAYDQGNAILKEVGTFLLWAIF